MSLRSPPESSEFPGRPFGFVVMNRVAAAQYTLLAPHAVISIGSPDRPPVELPEVESRVGTLRLTFDDVDIVGEPPPLSEWWADDAPPPVLFEESHAVSIRDFVLAHRERVEWIVCHCDAGLSRSPAVAIALSRWLNEDDVVAAAVAHWVVVERLGLEEGVVPWNRRVLQMLEAVLDPFRRRPPAPR